MKHGVGWLEICVHVCVCEDLLAAGGHWMRVRTVIRVGQHSPNNSLSSGYAPYTQPIHSHTCDRKHSHTYTHKRRHASRLAPLQSPPFPPNPLK